MKDKRSHLSPNHITRTREIGASIGEPAELIDCSLVIIGEHMSTTQRKSESRNERLIISAEIQDEGFPVIS